MSGDCRGNGPCECRVPDDGTFVNVHLKNTVCRKLFTNGALQFSITKQSARALAEQLLEATQAE